MGLTNQSRITEYEMTQRLSTDMIVVMWLTSFFISWMLFEKWCWLIHLLFLRGKPITVFSAPFGLPFSLFLVEALHSQDLKLNKSWLNICLTMLGFEINLSEIISIKIILHKIPLLLDSLSGFTMVEKLLSLLVPSHSSSIN